MDEEELAEAHKQSLQHHTSYDTFGSTAAEMARKTAAADASSGHAAIPALIPDEIITPVADSIGERKGDSNRMRLASILIRPGITVRRLVRDEGHGRDSLLPLNDPHCKRTMHLFCFMQPLCEALRHTACL